MCHDACQGRILTKRAGKKSYRQQNLTDTKRIGPTTYRPTKQWTKRIGTKRNGGQNISAIKRTGRLNV